MTLDRTEDVELVDAPTTLALSKIWKRQYEGLHDLIVKLDRDRIKAVQHPDKKLGSLPNGELDDLNERYNLQYRNSPIRYHFTSGYGSIWNDTRMDEWPVDLRAYIKFSTLRKAVVNFNRNANPEWNHEKAKKRLSEYNKLKEEVAENKHITMPEIQLPPTAPTMPFTARANELIQTFMNEFYDFEAKEYRRVPFTVVKLRKRGTGGNKRRILISIDEVLEETEDEKDKQPETDWEVAGAEQMVDITILYHELKLIEEFYDAPSVYASMMHHISHLEKFHEKEDEGEGEPSFP